MCRRSPRPVGRIPWRAAAQALAYSHRLLINGDGYHSEVLLMCDLTLTVEDAHSYDLHYGISSVPGDGIHLRRRFTGPGRPSGDLRLPAGDTRQPLCTKSITCMPDSINYDAACSALVVGDGKYRSFDGPAA
jgi:hypothetical protein